jgi:hypothetical protein
VSNTLESKLLKQKTSRGEEGDRNGSRRNSD